MKLAIAVVAGVVLSLTAGCGTADAMNNGDPVPPTPTHSAKAEGDSSYYPHVGRLPKALKLPKGFHWVKCPGNPRIMMACFKPA